MQLQVEEGVVAAWVLEANLAQWCAAALIVDAILHEALHEALSLDRNSTQGATEHDVFSNLTEALEAVAASRRQGPQPPIACRTRA